VEATLPGAFVPQTNEDLHALTNAIHAAKEGVGGYLYVSSPLMRALVDEMDERGMFESAEDARGKLLAQADMLSVDELQEILLATKQPTSPPEELPNVVMTPAEERIAHTNWKCGPTT
jgi:hypothetical protein